MNINNWISFLHGLRPLVFGKARWREKRRRVYFYPVIERLEERYTPDTNSAGPNGINALGLVTAPGGVALTGQGITIGQTEPCARLCEATQTPLAQ